MKTLSKKRIFSVCRGLLAFFIFYFSTLFKYIPIYIFKLDTNIVNSDIKLSILLALFSALCVSFILIVMYWKDLKEEFKKFKDNLLQCLDTGFACWVIGLVIMVSVNFILAYFLKSGGAKNENAVQSMISVAPLYMALDVCLLAPFNEEMVFRKALRDVSFNKYIFFFFSFLIFGGAHVIGSASSLVDYLYIIPYGALGGMFAYAYTKTDSIFTTITFHMIHNTVLFLMSILL